MGKWREKKERMGWKGSGEIEVKGK